MGKGDRKTKKGKVFKKSFGKKRKKKSFDSKTLIFRRNSFYRKRFSKKPSFKGTDQFSIITELSLALVSQKDDHYYPSGTAVIIAPYLALTAKHVLEDFFKIYDKMEIKNKTGAFDGSFTLFAFQTLGEIKDGSVFNVTRLWPCHGTDLCLLSLTPFSDSAKNYKWRSVMMDFSIPKIGDRISAFGYSDSKFVKSDTLSVSYKNSTSVGEIMEIHNPYRDQSRLNFPCVRVNTKFAGGMSGGPVFNENGHLCGLICSNFPSTSIYEEEVSYVTLLWPLLGTHIDIPYVELGKVNTYPIFLLVLEKIVNGRGYENISLKDGKLYFKN